MRSGAAKRLIAIFLGAATIVATATPAAAGTSRRVAQNEIANGTSFFWPGAPYPGAREELVRAGWQPTIFEIGLKSCTDPLCKAYPEFSNFYGTQPIPSRNYQVTWKRDGKMIQVVIFVSPTTRAVTIVSASCSNLAAGC